MPSPSEIAALVGIALVAAAVGYLGAGALRPTPPPALPAPELVDCVKQVRETRETTQLMRERVREADVARERYEQATPQR